MNRKEMIKLLDELWSNIIRSKGKCEVCGRTDTLSAHHLHPRNKFNTRWDIENGYCLCYQHHIHYAHKDIVDFYEWAKDKLGEKKFNDLKIRANISAKGQDLEAIRIGLENYESNHRQLPT